MSDVLADDVVSFLKTAGPEGDEVLAEMDAYAEREGFPHVGPEVGGFLRLLVRVAGAERIFEFGSGYGYSAYWFAGALSEGDEIVLTEVDADELSMAREYMDRGGFDADVRYELGDAIETIDSYEGPLDAVLIDNEKHRYREAFDAVREKLAPGAVVIADNMLAANTVYYDDVDRLLRGEETDATDSARGVAAYLERVRSDPDCETSVLPIGEGIAVTHVR
ncbi:O-methyltransferase [Natronorarus salvus]|uniref:O-methyltransferase n=1 Tax=Natronorarus salvus TaxID=3117733 RepID=UPI002F26B12D